MSYFEDHSKGHPKATRGSFISGIPKIHHNSCGGPVRPDYYTERWWCKGCGQGWTSYILTEVFTDDQVAERFHLRGDKDPTLHVLVWKVDQANGRRYTSCVPETEADVHERVKF